MVRALRDGAADSINRAGQRVVERQLSVRPTLTIRPGMPVRVILSGDFAIPLIRIETSQKCAKGVQLQDLAVYLDERADAARREMHALIARPNPRPH